ncbi:MAG: galactose oxidase [Ferruginibacter sp.]|nr:galactose oxidase [Cytophagales bacterium]
MKKILLSAGFLGLAGLLVVLPARSQTPQWKTVSPQNLPEVRSENAFARVGDQLYLFGGRKKQSVEAYSPRTKQWKRVAPVPLEMHHFQAITYRNEIYVLGAFTGDYPHETPIPRLYIYNPQRDQWRAGADIPEGRRRGAAGAFVYRDKIYLLNGITDGHYDGHVSWFDEYNPATNAWKILPDSPRPRDHFQAAVAGDRVVVAGGRRSTQRTGHVLDLTVPEVDTYDFQTNAWQTLPANLNLPTQRAGCTAVTLGNRVIIIGGESPQKLAHNQTEALDLRSNTWQTLPTLQTGRHGTQAVVYGKKLFIAAGSANQGGGPEINSLEVLE